MLDIAFPWSQNLPYVYPVAGPAQFITPYDILKSLGHVKNGKAAGPFGFVAEMLKGAPDNCCKIIADLKNAIMLEGKVRTDWSDGTTVSLFEGKGDGLDRSNCHGLKLTDHVLKGIERVVKKICGTVNVDELQFGFCPGQGRTDAIYILDSFKRSILQDTGNCTCHLLIWKRPSIECLERYCGGLFVSVVCQTD